MSEPDKNAQEPAENPKENNEQKTEIDNKNLKLK